jgi:hypothetical protein
MLRNLITAVFGCSHERTTFPRTPKPGSSSTETYVTCLNCGKNFEYDWKEMRRGKNALPDEKGPGTFVETRV